MMSYAEAKQIFESTRFTKKFIPEPNSGCWLWLGALASDGACYPRIRVGEKIKPAHTIACTAVHGQGRDGYEPDHLCRNPQCVNPDHLEWVTHKENISRTVSIFSVNMRKTHCVNGHAFNLENTWKDKHGFRHCKECRRAGTRKWYRTEGGQKYYRLRGRLS